VVRALIRAGVNVELPNRQGVSPLNAMCRCGCENLDIIRLLIDAGADPLLPAKDGTTPLEMAIVGRHTELALMLMGAAERFAKRDPDSASALAKLAKVEGELSEARERCASLEQECAMQTSKATAYAAELTRYDEVRIITDRKYHLALDDVIRVSKQLGELERSHKEELVRYKERERAEALSCVVCQERQRDVVLQPCGHVTLCGVCWRSITHGEPGNCPVCRVPVTSHMKVFLS